MKKTTKSPFGNLIKGLAVAILIFLFLGAIFSLFSSAKEQPQQISITKLVEDINGEKVKEITVAGDIINVIYQDDSRAQTQKEVGTTIDQALINFGVDKNKLTKVSISFQPVSDVWIWLAPLLMIILPLILFGAFFWFIFRQARTSGTQALDFTKANAKVFGPGHQGQEKITFDDIAGLKEAKEELNEVVDFLKNPQKYLKIGAKIPRGVLLIGPPGTGKTMLAKAIANESNVPFFSIAGSEFIELFVGVGSSRVRSLFDQARKVGKAIIFIDEIDSIGKVRGVGITGGHEEREQTLNQLLAEMDGIGREENIIVLGATNRPEYLDPALLRPGRFDRRIVLDLPDVKDREEILKVHCRNKPLGLDVNLAEISERTPGFSGADLANLVNEAAILAARRNKEVINQAEFIEAIEKVLLGPERKSHILSPEEKRIAAYHEVGHALVATFSKRPEPVRKISIIARGMAAGYTLKIPKEEKKLKNKSEYLAEIATYFGGYCAEKIKFGEITTGASNDLEEATELAKKLVKEYGMSSLGPINFGKKYGSLFLGEEYFGSKEYSEEVAAKIDREVEKIIRGCEKEAEKILKSKKKFLDKIAKVLIEKETIEKEEFERLIKEAEKEETISQKINQRKETTKKENKRT